jgi:predicted ATPase
MRSEPYLKDVILQSQRVRSWDVYPFTVPAVQWLKDHSIEFHPKCTFFIGENGSGKSTLLEGIAELEGFHPAGGTRNFNYESRERQHDNALKWVLSLGKGVLGKLRRDGFFFRAESFYNAASYIEQLEEGLPAENRLYGDKSLHEQSHGEAFLTLFTERLTGGGLYFFDEPEAALSPQRQLSFLTAMHDWIQNEAQLVIATHSPIIMAYPNAWIYEFNAQGIRRIEYEQTEHHKVTRAFLTRRDAMLRELLQDELLQDELLQDEPLQ